MTLIKSISGIRGTIGGPVGQGLTPLDVVKYAAAYGTWVKTQAIESKLIVIGRDARLSGDMVSRLVAATLQGLGLDVCDLGLSTTPTVEMAVPAKQAAGGIILTASHNPKQWNALKLLNAHGEFISEADGQQVLASAESEDFEFAPVTKLGQYTTDEGFLEEHIKAILALSLQERGRLADDTLVATVMSNLGLKRAMADAGITVLETGVGDRYVLEKMNEGGFSLGGEQSGHIIFNDYATTGDGVLTGLHLVAEMARTGKSLQELASCMTVFPQVLLNVRGVDRHGLDDQGVQDAIAAATEALGDAGRVLLRPSGTEPVVRVMVEAASQEDAQRVAEELAAVVRDRLAIDAAA